MNKKIVLTTVFVMFVVIVVIFFVKFFKQTEDSSNNQAQKVEENDVSLDQFTSFLKEHNFQAGIIEILSPSNRDKVMLVSPDKEPRTLFSRESLGYDGGVGPLGISSRSPSYPKALALPHPFFMKLTNDRGAILYRKDFATRQDIFFDLQNVFSEFGIEQNTKQNSLYGTRIRGTVLDTIMPFGDAGISPLGDFVARDILVNYGNRNSAWDNESATGLFRIESGSKSKYVIAGNLKEEKVIAKSESQTETVVPFKHIKNPHFSYVHSNSAWSLDGEHIAFIKEYFTDKLYDQNGEPRVNDIKIKSEIAVYSIKTGQMKYLPSPITCPSAKYLMINCGIVSFISPTDFIIGQNDGTYYVKYTGDDFEKVKIFDNTVKLLGVLP